MVTGPLAKTAVRTDELSVSFHNGRCNRGATANKDFDDNGGIVPSRMPHYKERAFDEKGTAEKADL